MLFIDGHEAKITLDELIAKGRELIAAGYPSATHSFAQEMNAAVTAVHWYGEQHRLWIESRKDVDAISSAPVSAARPEFEGLRTTGRAAVKTVKDDRTQPSLLDTLSNS